jgi:hypothetical protein
VCSGLIVLGGLYDIFAPRLPENLHAACGADERASRLVRELLRALGGALVAIGLAVAVLAAEFGLQDRREALLLILLLVIPSEGINSFCMYRAGSPFYVPLAFLLLALLGVALAWPGLIH